MIMWFEKFLLIGVGALLCVSCATPQRYPTQTDTMPIKRQEEAIVPTPSKVQPVPSLNVPTQPAPLKPSPAPTPVTPPTEPVIPTEPSLPSQSLKPTKPVEPSVQPVVPTEPSFPSSPTTPTKPVTKPSTQPETQKPPTPVTPQLPSSLASLQNKSAVPGGIAWVPISSQSATPPKINYQQRRVVVLHDGQQWVALVGIPLSAKSGKHTVIDQRTKKRYSFQVKNKKYKTQRITLKNKRYVHPNRKDLQRIQRERKLIKAALATPWRKTATSPLPLEQPVRGRFSSPFGLRRYFNGQPRNPHTGLDIAARQGTSVGAAASGKIVKTGHYFFTGKTIFIDHGQGIVTLYGHLNTIAVSRGQKVKKGQTIGTVGKTGRATGPHLHWSVSMNNTMVDPTLVME